MPTPNQILFLPKPNRLRTHGEGPVQIDLETVVYVTLGDAENNLLSCLLFEDVTEMQPIWSHINLYVI